MLEDMAAKGHFPIKADSYLHGVAIVLKSVACEWLLMFFLLLDAAFSYFLTKFAQYCDLQVPCILCSRLDHVFGNEKPHFYRNLLCYDHKSELSSVVLCQNHGNLADVHEMCEECLLSFATKETNHELHKILVGKLRLDCLQKPFLSMDSHMRPCSCCAKPWRSRPNVQKSVQSKLSGHVAKPDIPLPKSPVHKCLNRQEGLKKRKETLSQSPLFAGHHVGYSKGKVNSDPESDFHFSDEDEMNNVPQHQKNVKDDYLTHLDLKSPKRQYDDVFPAGLIHRTLESSILMHSDDEPEKGETTTPTCLGTNGDGRHFFIEPSLQHICTKPSPAHPEFRSLDDVPLSSNAPEISLIVSADGRDEVSLSKKFGSFGLSDNVSHSNTPPSTNMQLPVGLTKEKWLDTKENGDVDHGSAVNNWESIDLNSTSSVTGKGTDNIRKELASKPNSSAFDDLDSSTSRHLQASSLLPEKVARRDCNGTGSNEFPIVSGTSLSHTKYATVNGHVDGPQMISTPVSMESSVPSKSHNVETSRCLEPLEESVGETDNLVDKLRQQLEYRNKCIENLQKELEEERNAAAVAANQAMAMITKLQEEKAALHMESLQYLRMMEEQAEYDMEALEKKEKEIQDLEAELDYFRIKYPEDFPEWGDVLGEGTEMDESRMETIDFEA